MTPGRARGAQRFDSVRARLLLLMAIAAIPLVLMAATIAWQNYALVASRAANVVLRLREAASARIEASIEGTEQMLGTLAQSQSLLTAPRATCDHILTNALLFGARQYSNIVLLDPDGTVRCTAAPLPADSSWRRAAPAAWFGQVRSRGQFVLGGIAADAATGKAALIAAYPLMENGVFQGAVAAGLRADWFGRAERTLGDRADLALWFADSAGHVVPLEPTAASVPLSAPVLAKLRQGNAAEVEARARDGEPFIYSRASLAGQLTLIAGYRAGGVQAQARRILLTRIGVLGVLLLAALAAVGVGARYVLLDPLLRLSAAVSRWRERGVFDPGPLAALPLEMRNLAQSFARATAALDDRERELRGALEQQQLLMQEIHHRVKNNLQIVASLLNLQANRIRVPQARAEFESARDRVRALATLHRHLYAYGELHTINMRGFLEELCGQLFQAMGEREGNRIALEIEAPEIKMSTDQAVPLSLIVTEAVSNALKYAFPGGRRGRVSVRLTATEDTAELIVQDDGVGIPGGRVETETGTRDGIGIQLIRGFARQLGASLEVEEDGGTRYRLRMPLRRTREDGEDPEEESIAGSPGPAGRSPSMVNRSAPG